MFQRIIDWVKGIKRCPHCNKARASTDRHGPICGDCYHPVEWFFPAWPMKIMDIFDMTTKSVEPRKVRLTVGQWIMKLREEYEELSEEASDAKALLKQAEEAKQKAFAERNKAQENLRQLHDQNQEYQQRAKADYENFVFLQKKIDGLCETIRERDVTVETQEAVILQREAEIRAKESHLKAKEEIIIAQNKALGENASDLAKLRNDIEALRKDCEQVRSERDLASGDLKIAQAKLLREQDFAAKLRKLFTEATKLIEEDRIRKLNERCNPAVGHNLTIGIEAKQMKDLLGTYPQTPPIDGASR